jgi:hypothetical protein
MTKTLDGRIREEPYILAMISAQLISGKPLSNVFLLETIEMAEYIINVIDERMQEDSKSRRVIDDKL